MVQELSLLGSVLHTLLSDQWSLHQVNMMQFAVCPQISLLLILVSLNILIRMAVKLWSTRTPGTAQLQRDLMVMNNKKKVGLSHTHRNNYNN